MDRDGAAPGSDTDSGKGLFRPVSLDVLNLLLVDVNGAIKPDLNVYLFVHRGWDDAAVGLVGTVAGLVGIVLPTPTGGLWQAATGEVERVTHGNGADVPAPADARKWPLNPRLGPRGFDSPPTLSPRALPIKRERSVRRGRYDGLATALA